MKVYPLTEEAKPDLYPKPLGPETWWVCTACDLDEHRCPLCGDSLTHSEFCHPTKHYRECRPDLFDEEGNYIHGT